MTKIKNYQMLAIGLLAFAVVSAVSAHAQYSVLHNFGSRSGDGGNPAGVLAQGEDGSLYGTTGRGEANGEPVGGTIFKITPQGQEKILYTFCSVLAASCPDGYDPEGGLTLRPDGHFIGTTSGGGSANAGTIFDVSPTGTLTTLYTFTGGADGASPLSPPILGPDGSFYGVTSSGGTSTQKCGTIYRINNGVFTLLYDFFTTVGCNPFRLVLGTDGNFYGTIGRGIYRATLRPGKEILVTVLYSFDGSAGFYPDDLVEGADGNFYGTTAGESAPTINGSVFKMTPAGTVTLLDSLSPWEDEAWGPMEFGDGLVQASDGNLYGVEEFGQTNSVGALFQAIPAGGFSFLQDFGATTAAYPLTPPIQHTNGVLYGETVTGGSGSLSSCIGNCGVFYSWNGNLPPFVSTVQLMGAVGSTVEILGQGFNSLSTVSFNGVAATATIQSGTSLFAAVPAGATTGPITVTTSTGTLKSNRPFVVTP